MANITPLKIVIYVCFIGIFLGASVSSAQETQSKTTKSEYLNDRERGWHWYEVKPIAPEKKDVLPIEAPKAPGPAPLTVKWLSEKLEEYKEIAINNPTRENVERYNYMQKLVMDKAEKFALMSQEVNTLNPSLDETIVNPVTSAANVAQTKVREETTSMVINKLAGDVGLYYFYKSDCQYCLQMNTTLRSLQDKNGYQIKAIALDGKAMPDGKFPNWVADQGQASLLGVTSTPTIYMFKPPNKVVLVSAGLQVIPELKRRIMVVANSNKWLSDDDFALAIKGLRRDFLIDATTSEDNINWDDPDDVLVKLRSISKYGVESATLTDSQIFKGTPWIKENK